METIFLFHRVHPSSDPLWNPMSPAIFESIIKYLNRNYLVLNIEEYFTEKKKSGKKDIAMIAFDDGYKDFLDYAFPILKKYNTPASMYVVTDSVEKGLAPWTYNFDYVMVNSEKFSIGELKNIPLQLRENKWKNKDERIRFAKKIKRYLKTLSNKNRNNIYNEILTSFNDIKLPTNLMLNWEDIIYLKREGVVIGSHTVSHPLLSKIEDEEELNFELKKSFSILEEKLGGSPLTISYPNGSFDERVIKIAKEAGYKMGLAVKQRQINVNDSIYDLSRFDMYDGERWRLKWYINRVANKIKFSI